MAGQRALNRTGLTKGWFERRERKIQSDERAHTVHFEEYGDLEGRHALFYLPGQFDYDYNTEERIRRISMGGGLRTIEDLFNTHHNPPPELVERWFDTLLRNGNLVASKEDDPNHIEPRWKENDPPRIVAVEALYSVRDTEQNIECIKNIIETTAAHARVILDEDPTRTLVFVGYSFGGVMGKILADKLAKEYSGRIGLVAHNAPLDPELGEFVRGAGMQHTLQGVGYDPVYDSAFYPAVFLTGTKDLVVPRESAPRTPDGKEVTVKLIHADHSDPCANPAAALAIRAAIELVQRRLKMRTHLQTSSSVRAVE